MTVVACRLCSDHSGVFHCALEAAWPRRREGGGAYIRDRSMITEQQMSDGNRSSITARSDNDEVECLADLGSVPGIDAAAVRWLLSREQADDESTANVPHHPVSCT